MPDSLTPAFLTIPGARLCYRDSGGDGAPLVMLHANTGTSASWRPQFESFANAGYRVIAFDRRGWGNSAGAPDTGPQPGSIAEDLLALATQLSLPKFHLLGVAGGGFAALDFAGWQQDRLRSLVIAASTGSFSEPDMERLSKNISFEGFGKLPETFREIGPSFRALEPERTREWAHAQETARQRDAPAQPLRTPNTFDKISQITIPFLAITASADLLAPPALMARWIRQIPHARVISIADAGHCVPMEQPEVFNNAVLNFIRNY